MLMWKNMNGSRLLIYLNLGGMVVLLYVYAQYKSRPLPGSPLSFQGRSEWAISMRNKVIEQRDLKSTAESSVFHIYTPIRLPDWLSHGHTGQRAFLGCPVSRCSLDTSMVYGPTADAVLFFETFQDLWFRRPASQRWVYFSMESPMIVGDLRNAGSQINWTATYRVDSDIPVPYGMWVEGPQTTPVPPFTRTHKVAWFVSNCNPSNLRLTYYKELAKHVKIDVYGACGKPVCGRKNKDCMRNIISKYKFYLAFENANCLNYITEKLFENALKFGPIPIVMGAPRQDYEQHAPPNSFIHVNDFPGPKHLAAYINLLDKDEELYQFYHQWRTKGHIDTKKDFLCRLCAMLHQNSSTKYYEQLSDWWYPQGMCSST